MSTRRITRTVMLLAAGLAAGALSATAATTVMLSSSNSNSVYGSAVTLTATVTPAGATGKVTFYDGTTILGIGELSGGVATLTTTLLPAGAERISVYYSGDSSNASARSGTLAQTVHALAGGGFQKPYNFGAGRTPWSLAIGDFNGDGKPDVAVTFDGASEMSVVLSNGDGTYRDPVSYSGVNNARWIVAADFNGDGFADLAVANYSGNSVSVFLGNGNGTFQPGMITSVGAANTNSYAVVAADFNGDGIADIAVANSGANEVSILLGNGDGTFRQAAQVPVGIDPRSIAVGDFNGDGNADLVTGNYTANTISIALGNGDGTFRQSTAMPTSGNAGATTNPRSIVVSDFNHDGTQDLAVANQSTNEVAILMGNGDGTFGPPASACPDCVDSDLRHQYLNQPYFVAAGDFNGDGVPDLVTANYGGNNVGLLLGNGDGTFMLAGLFPCDLSPTWVATADFRGNGLTDAITANTGGGTLSFLMAAAPAPDLTISMMGPAVGSLAQGLNATYTITVTNAGFAGTSGTVTVTDTLPAGLTLLSLAGTGWNCALTELTCMRSDSLAPLQEYPAIELTVTAAANAPGGVTNTASVSGGGETNLANDTASDYTTTFSAKAVSAAWASELSLMGTPSAFTNPGIGAGAPLLMTDGTVLVHQSCSGNWYELAPDKFGNYTTGQWTATPIASMPSGYSPLYFSSAVLPDGRLVVIGGEYNGNGCAAHAETNLGAIYDPVANLWTSLPSPPGWTQVGDATNVVLPKGNLLLAQNSSTGIGELNPYTLTWTNLNSSGKADANAEEGWTLLPDGTVLTVDVASAGQSERYFPSTDSWGTLGDTSVPLIASREMGPQVLRPDGTVFASGATGHTGIYNSLSETWTAGPDFPAGPYGLLAAADAPGVLLPGGNVLIAASGFSVGAIDPWQQTSFFFEFDGTHLNPVPAPAAPTTGSYRSHLLLLPNGQVLFTDNADVSIYSPGGTPNPAWAPAITSAPATVELGQTYTLNGTQFNGLSQAVMYGDDYQAATNYPLVQLVNTATGHVVYCRTHNHSTMAVATGSATVSTQFDVPATAETGPSTLVVIANGIASTPRSVTVSSPTSVVPTINAIVGGALSVPAVKTISTDSYFTIFGAGFESGNATTASATSMVNGSLPITLNSICVYVGSARAFLSYVSDTQINAVAPLLALAGVMPVKVVADCGSSSQRTSASFSVQLAAASPEFLYWVHNTNGQNPVLAVSNTNGNFIGPTGLNLGVSLRPAHPGESITVYGIGFGPTMAGPIPGTPASSSDGVQGNVSVTVGGRDGAASYVGVTPTVAGLYQANMIVPAELAAGNYPISITVNGTSSLPGAFLIVGQ